MKASRFLRGRRTLAVAFAVALVMTALGLIGAHAWRHADKPGPESGPVPVRLGDRASCLSYNGLPAGFGMQARAGMVHLPGGRFELGSLRGYAEERPPRRVDLPDFWIDRTEVTNAQFAAFVVATEHVTDAERRQESVIFELPHDVNALAGLAAGAWWQLRAGTDWRHPEGPGSSLAGRENQPVVHVTRADAEAYAIWLGRALPTEAQWEYAALAGRSDAAADAALRTADGGWNANFWQGLFPYAQEAGDGFAGRAPVGCYGANPFGLHDLVGNVWEWTGDAYRENHGVLLPGRVHAGLGVIKGGSYLCAANYCARARSAARQPQEPDLPMSHLGFRTVFN